MSASDGPVKLQPRRVQSKRIEITDEIRQAVLAPTQDHQSCT